jgi:hypothetical protein
MKKAILFLSVLTLLSIAILTSCNSPAEKVEAAEQNLDKAKADYTKQYNAFKLESEEKISANEKIISDLKVQLKNKKGKFKYEVDSLEKRNLSMRGKVQEYKAGGNEQWKTFKMEFNHDLKELGEALKDITVSNIK